MELSQQQIADFRDTLWEQYRHYGRPELPWRQSGLGGGFDPYKIMVSELMLQQTQVARVVPKYQAFLERFPNVRELAAANLGDVLRAWQGLGYNRRAKFLWQAAQQIAELGTFPTSLAELVKLPGIGPNTAGAVLAYAFDQPVVFVETNIRSVYIHHFFHDQTGVSDKDILSLVAQTLNHSLPREFYWALMDYGSYLKATVGNLNTASKHYTKQSTFHGSRRQIRGTVIRLLTERSMTKAELAKLVPDNRLESVLDELVTETLIRKKRRQYGLE